MLLARGADPSAVTIDGETPLHFAARGRFESIALLLVNRGADVSAAAQDRSTPLHVAASHGNEAIALPATRDDSTPLHVAAREGQGGVALLLLARGADLRVTKKSGLSPLRCAERHGRRYMIQLLRDANNST